jgi:hypothetical protein
MPVMTTTLKVTDIDHALTTVWDPASNNWGAFQTALLNRLRARHAAAAVSAVDVDILATANPPMLLKIKVTSTGALTGPQVKAAIA